ncbi:NUDIX domain-containing protein [Phytomonospora sp. NPDC050363]|uniref:NUDIX hydrolase n=1 Tax=Phytomonospora sp. NPDC050363 TaxID=3155642 RepID=UPI0034065EDC
MVNRRRAGLLRGTVYRVFYRLPRRMQRFLARRISPKYILGAVVLLHDLEGERLLLLRQPPGHGWGLPAGLINRGERPQVAAVRELAEETGVRLEGGTQLVPAEPSAVVHTSGRWVDVVFTARVDPDEVEVSVDGAEVLDAQWHELSALPPLTPASAKLLSHYGIGPYTESLGEPVHD